MRRPGHMTEIAISAAMVASTGLFAQTSDRPTVTVLEFETPARMDGGALADDFASALIDSNRFRVLPRQWLPQPTGAAPSLAAHRSNAAAAGVQFLIAGTVSRVRPRGVLAALRGPSAQATVVDVRVLATDSGDVVRAESVRADTPVRRAMPPPRSIGLSSLLMAGVQQRASASREAESAKRAVLSIARTLDLSDVTRR